MTNPVQSSTLLTCVSSSDLSGGDTSSIPSSDYPIPDTPSTPLSPSTPSTPAIMLDKASTIRKREKVESDTMTAEEEARALQTKEKRRRCECMM